MTAGGVCGAFAAGRTVWRRERFRLYPAGCRMLELDGGAAGYALSHPWVFGAPRLNTLLGTLPAPPVTLYLHNVVLLPAARSCRAASLPAGQLAELARIAGLPGLSPVAVNGSAAFWERQDFSVVRDPAVKRELRSYNPAPCFMAWSLP